MKRILKKTISGFHFKSMSILLAVLGVFALVAPISVQAVTTPCIFNPTNISNFQKTFNSDPSISTYHYLNISMLVVNDNTAGKAIFVCSEPNLPDPFELEIEFGGDASAGVLEDLGNQLFDSGIRAGFTAGNLAFHICLIKRGGIEVVALRTATGFTNGIPAPWSTGLVTARIRRNGNTATLEVGGQSESTTNLGPDINAGIQFGTYSPAARVRAFFTRIDAITQTAKPLDVAVSKLEVKTFGVSEVEHDVEGRDEDDAARKSGIKFEGVIHAADGSMLDPTVMQVSVAISGPNGKIYNSGAIASDFVFNGNEYKYETTALKMELEQQNATSFVYALEMKQHNAVLPAGDYSTLTATITVGDYQGSVTVPLTLKGHKWKYSAP